MYNKKLSGALVASALLASASAMAGVTDGAVLSNTCNGCHGTHGASASSAPVIGGLSEAYLASTMANYKDGSRFATVMGRIAKGYDQGQFLDMAKFFAAQPWVSSSVRGEAKLADKERREGRSAITEADRRRWLLPGQGTGVRGQGTGIRKQGAIRNGASGRSHSTLTPTGPNRCKPR